MRKWPEGTTVSEYETLTKKMEEKRSRIAKKKEEFLEVSILKLIKVTHIKMIGSAGKRWRIGFTSALALATWRRT